MKSCLSFLKKIGSSRIASNSGWIIGGKLLQMLLSFLIGLFTVRYMGPANYGVINTAYAYTYLFLPVCSLGFSGIFAKVIRDHPGEDGTYLGSGIAVRLTGSLLSVVMLSGIVRLMNPNDRLLQSVCFIYSFTLLFQSFDLFEYWYQARYASKYSSIIGVIGYAVSSVYKVFLLVSGKSVEWFAFASALDYAVIALIYMTYTVKKNRLRLKISGSAMASMIGLSRHLILANLLVVLYGQMDKIMLEKLSSAAEVGLYSAALTLCTMWTFVLSAVINSMRPEIVELHVSDKKVYHNRIVQLYSLVFWVSAGVSAVFCAGAEFVVSLLYGAEYTGAAGCLRIVTWYTGFSYLGVARNIWTVCEGKQRYEKYFAAAGIGTNFVLNLLLIPLMGIEGAALASLLTQIVTNAVMPALFRETRENAVLIVHALNPVHLLRMFGVIH